MNPTLSALRQGIRLPPGGWALAGMLAFYVLAGMFGRDPWKGEDAIHIGTAWHMLSHGDWLAPSLAGEAFNEPPLYYWSAALFGKLLGGLLPMHEAMRLASAAWIALALTGIYYAARELYGQDSAAAAPLLLAGSTGLILHAHDAQPMLIALAAHCGTMGALATRHRQPRLSTLFYGVSLAACLLGAGIAASLPLLAAGLWQLAEAPERRPALRHFLGSLFLAALLIAPWPLLLEIFAPQRLGAWWQAEWQSLLPSAMGERLKRLLALLPWMAFPTLPIAAWTLWRRRQQLSGSPERLPLGLFLLTLTTTLLTFPAGEIALLLCLPALALLATPGALSLRRGAANAFDWFAMSTFSLFMLLTWIAWSAMALGWPAQLAGRVVALRPGFVGHISPIAALLGLGVTLWWLWLIVTAPRSPYRSLIHWSLGFTALWLLLTTLLLPWFDYGRSYRPVAEAVARALPDNQTCVSELGLGDAERASLAYFSGIEAQPLRSAAGRRCHWLLVQSERRKAADPAGEGWQKVWEGNRPGNRRERFVLYRREAQ